MLNLTSRGRGAVGLVGVLVVLLHVTNTFAQTGPDLLIKPWPKGQHVEADGGITFLDDGHTNRASQLQMTFYDTSGRVRLFPAERADPRFGWDVRYINLNTNDPALPSKLVDTSVAFGMGVADQNGWLAGISAAVGYAAAGAFDDGQGFYGKADFAIGKELDETQAIGFVLDYDGNRTLLPDVPLPGFEYRKRLDTTLLLAVGFPFSSITWKPNDKLTIDAKYVFPDDAEAKVDYGFVENVGVFVSYAAQYDAFHFDALPNSHDRLLFRQRRAEAGLRLGPWYGANFVGAVGYAFSQEFNVGWDSTDQERVAKPSDEPYLRVGFELRY